MSVNVSFVANSFFLPYPNRLDLLCSYNIFSLTVRFQWPYLPQCSLTMRQYKSSLFVSICLTLHYLHTMCV